MEKRRVIVKVLHGTWNTTEDDGTGIIGISEDIDELKKKLAQIAETKASEYLRGPFGKVKEEIAGRYYEIIDSAGGYAKFYISEHELELSDGIIEALCRAKQDEYIKDDVREMMRNLYEAECLSEKEYEYCEDNENVIKRIIARFEKTESCNIPFNVTMEEAVKEVIKELDIVSTGERHG